MARGDHIYVERLGGVYAHHGIDIGEGQAIEFNADSWLKPRRVRLSTIEAFAKEGEVRVREYDSLYEELEQSNYFEKASRTMRGAIDRMIGKEQVMDFSPDAVVARAKKRLGEYGFDLFFNNCEHFATWCKTGISDSSQINALWQKVLENTSSMAANQKKMLEGMQTNSMLELPYHMLSTHLGSRYR